MPRFQRLNLMGPGAQGLRFACPWLLHRAPLARNPHQ